MEVNIGGTVLLPLEPLEGTNLQDSIVTISLKKLAAQRVPQPRAASAESRGGSAPMRALRDHS